jgi:hypothetical protein
MSSSSLLPPKPFKDLALLAANWNLAAAFALALLSDVASIFALELEPGFDSDCLRRIGYRPGNGKAPPPPEEGELGKSPVEAVSISTFVAGLASDPARLAKAACISASLSSQRDLKGITSVASTAAVAAE